MSPALRAAVRIYGGAGGSAVTFPRRATAQACVARGFQHPPRGAPKPQTDHGAVAYGALEPPGAVSGKGSAASGA